MLALNNIIVVIIIIIIIVIIIIIIIIIITIISKAQNYFCFQAVPTIFHELFYQRKHFLLCVASLKPSKTDEVLFKINKNVLYKMTTKAFNRVITIGSSSVWKSGCIYMLL